MKDSVTGSLLSIGLIFLGISAGIVLQEFVKDYFIWFGIAGFLMIIVGWLLAYEEANKGKRL